MVSAGSRPLCWRAHDRPGPAHNSQRRDDPTVVVQAHDGWTLFLDRMSTAWVELVLSESMFAGDGPAALYDACELPETLLPTLQRQYRRVDFPDHPMWASSDNSPLRWYVAPGRLLRHDGTQDHSWLDLLRAHGGRP